MWQAASGFVECCEDFTNAMKLHESPVHVNKEISHKFQQSIQIISVK